MLLPHERDESADRTRAAAGPDPEMKQAHEDVAAGRQDTDCHAQPQRSPGGPCDPGAVRSDKRKE